MNSDPTWSGRTPWSPYGHHGGGNRERFPARLRAYQSGQEKSSPEAAQRHELTLSRGLEVYIQSKRCLTTRKQCCRLPWRPLPQLPSAKQLIQVTRGG